jgi:uncharacterized membrane protein
MKIDVPSAHREKTKINKNQATNKDTRFRSLKETFLDVGLGLIISTIINFTVLPLFATGIANREIFTMIQISVIYTVLALIRRYGMRRAFENKNWGL